MSKIDWVLIAVFILGFVLFLYGSNIYNASLGYGGIYLCIGSIAAYIIVYIYKELKRKKLVKRHNQHQLLLRRMCRLRSRRWRCTFRLGTE
jgi:multisubunit Na+/H+ antiporter MnhB subunit